MNSSIPPSPGIPAHVADWLRARRSDPRERTEALEALQALIAIDTTPKPDPAAARAAEQQVFAQIRHLLSPGRTSFELAEVPIRPAIAGYPYFTLPYYAMDPTDPARPNDPEAVTRRVYADRSNLFARLAHPGHPVLAINAHIDTVAPFIPPRVVGNVVHGRGAVDDKGPCLAMALAGRWLAEIRDRFEITPPVELLLQFVIDEETGGNGSLSAAHEAELGRADAFIVLECTGARIHPANRGAVWYEIRLTQPADLANPGAGQTAKPDRGVEASAFVVEALEACGRAIKSESQHPMFPHRPVQTCHGRLGPFGEHPSRVGDHMALQIQWEKDLDEAIQAAVAEAVRTYTDVYGDKTVPGVGEATLDRHYTWQMTGNHQAILEVFGLAGHMGSVDRLDGAITKASAIVRRLVELREQNGGVWSSLTIRLPSVDPAEPTLIMEGGQGFLPTHTLEQVCDRMGQAAQKGLERYQEALRAAGPPDPAIEALRVETRFDKLHNDAYAGRTDGPVLAAMLAASAETGVDQGPELRGWDVSCDARIFARAFPEAEIITFGPGPLVEAHANTEHVDLDAILTAAELLARTVLGIQSS